MRTSAAFLLLLGAGLAGCGYVGDPRVPSLRIPGRVTDLAAVERGDSVLIHFTAPAATTDGVLLYKPLRIELRGGPSSGEPFDIEQWAATAREIPVSAAAPGPVELKAPAAGWAGSAILLAVRVHGHKGHAGEWSNLVTLHVAPPLAPPSELKAEATAGGVSLNWRGAPGQTFRIYRRAGAEPRATLLGRAEAPPFVDAGSRFGERYAYSVQAAMKAGESEAESEISASVEIVPVDRFPPAVPAGLNAIASASGVELSWDPNADPDLKGYRLYRAAGAGKLEKIADLLDKPAYGDRAVSPGQSYRYAVAAVDQAGNESALSAPVEIRIQ